MYITFRRSLELGNSLNGQRKVGSSAGRSSLPQFQNPQMYVSKKLATCQCRLPTPHGKREENTNTIDNKLSVFRDLIEEAST